MSQSLLISKDIKMTPSLWSIKLYAATPPTSLQAVKIDVPLQTSVCDFSKQCDITLSEMSLALAGGMATSVTCYVQLTCRHVHCISYTVIGLRQDFKVSSLLKHMYFGWMETKMN